MGRLLTGSINLTKIDKTKIQTTNKFGEPFKDGAKYLNISVWVEDEHQVDQYGNIASISTGTSADDRKYIGNLKEFKKAEPAQIVDLPVVPAGNTDDLPF
jgi:hypothetical protein